jgi:hypothetical protein
MEPLKPCKKADAMLDTLLTMKYKLAHLNSIPAALDAVERDLVEKIVQQTIDSCEAIIAEETPKPAAGVEYPVKPDLYRKGHE